jgi:competence protein ComEA
MWQSLAIRLGMLAATMGIVVWIGWTVPTTLTRPAHGETQSGSDSQSGSPSVVVSPLGLESTTSTPLTSSQHGAPVVERKQGRAKLDLNRASAQEFDELPGIGPVLAERIVLYRKSGKTFRTVDDLRAVKGIGKKKFDRIRALVTVTPTAGQPERGKRAA